MVTTGHLVHRQAISASSGQNELGKKPSVLTNFCFRSISSDTLVPGSPWSPQVTRHTGRLSQLSVVKMSWGKNSKKKPSVLTNFCLRSISSDTLVQGSPLSPQVTRHTGRLSLLSVVEMS